MKDDTRKTISKQVVKRPQLNHDLPYRNVFEMMVEDAIHSMKSMDEESSVSSESCMCNHLECITEKTFGENGSHANNNLRFSKKRYMTDLRVNDSTLFYDDESIPSELSLGQENEFCIYECFDGQNRRTEVYCQSNGYHF